GRCGAISSAAVSASTVLWASRAVTARVSGVAVLLMLAGGAADPAAALRALRIGATDSIPLPEHPRPDFQRADWLNLNGRWQFAFDPGNDGERTGWASGALPAGREILVPFSWGSPLSGVADSADIGWYARTIAVPHAWGRGAGRRVLGPGARGL